MAKKGKSKQRKAILKAAKAERQKSKLNPFETLISKKAKHAVLNRKKQQKAKSLVTKRSKALKERYDSIKEDYAAVTRSNAFEDNRFGENARGGAVDDSEKYLKRFVKARTKRNKYNIDENEGDSFGVSLGLKDSSESLPDDEEFDAADLVEKLYQNEVSNDNTSNTIRKKTRDEVLQEVMMKAKLFKAERQKEKLENDEDRERNDDEYGKLLESNIGLQFKLKKKDKLKDLTNDSSKKVKETDQYSNLLNDLRLASRVKATEKTLSPDEQARRDKRKLEELQNEYNQRRKEEIDLNLKKAKLDSDIYGNDNTTEMFNNPSVEDTLDDEDVSKALREATIKLKEKKLPFVIELEADFTHLDLLNYLKGYQNEENVFVTFCDRVLKSNSIHLQADNRKKLSNFLVVLIEHLMYISCFKRESKKRKLFSTTVEEVIQQIYVLCQMLVKNLEPVFLQTLLRLKNRLKESLLRIEQAGALGADFGRDHLETGFPHKPWLKLKRGGHKGKKGRKEVESDEIRQQEVISKLFEDDGKVSEYQCWPGPGEIAFLRLVLFLFPTAKFRHPISGSALLLIEEYLSSCPVRGPIDASAALCLCQILVEASNLQKHNLIESTSTLYSGKVGRTLHCLLEMFGNQKCSEFEKYLKLRPDLCSLKSKNSKNFSLSFKKNEEKVSPFNALQLPISEKNCLDQSILISILDCLEYLPVTEATSVLKLGYQELLPKLKEIASSKLPKDSIKRIQIICKKFSVVKLPLVGLDVKSGDIVKCQQPRFSVEHFGLEPKTAKTTMKNLQKQVKSEKKNLLKDIRRDATLMASKRAEEQLKRRRKQKDRLKKNMQFLEEMNRNINNAVKGGAKISGGGSNSVNMRGKRRR